MVIINNIFTLEQHKISKEDVFKYKYSRTELNEYRYKF